MRGERAEQPPSYRPPRLTRSLLLLLPLLLLLRPAACQYCQGHASAVPAPASGAAVGSVAVPKRRCQGTGRRHSDTTTTRQIATTATRSHAHAHGQETHGCLR